MDGAGARHGLSSEDVCNGGGGGQEEHGLVKLGRAPAEAAGDPTRAAKSPLPCYASFFVKS